MWIPDDCLTVVALQVHLVQMDHINSSLNVLPIIQVIKVLQCI